MEGSDETRRGSAHVPYPGTSFTRYPLSRIPYPFSIRSMMEVVE
jgi:hypothetical protein